MGKWITVYICDVSKFLSRTAVYRDENIELHGARTTRDASDIICIQSSKYSRYLTYHHFELQAPKHKNSSAYEQLKTYGMGASLTRRKFSIISTNSKALIQK